jgi:hypothetical protein
MDILRGLKIHDAFYDRAKSFAKKVDTLTSNYIQYLSFYYLVFRKKQRGYIKSCICSKDHVMLDLLYFPKLKSWA